MDYISNYLNFILHINIHLPELITQYGTLVYAVGFLIILLECGFILTPFLPGESMLFAFGAVAASANLSINLIAFILIIAAIIGGFLNYALGYFVGKQFLTHRYSESFKKHLNKAELFYDKHGMMAILLARLIPIVRTFIPFIAGLIRMKFSLFSLFNILGGIVWISLFCYLGYFFGSLPFVKEHFSWFVIAIIVFSIVPLTVEYIKTIRNNKNASTI